MGLGKWLISNMPPKADYLFQNHMIVEFPWIFAKFTVGAFSFPRWLADSSFSTEA
jgi:hypothetical protein